MAPNPSNSVTPAYTPWRHGSELAMIRDWLYPAYTAPDPYSAQPPDMRLVAVQHMQMWSFKDSKLSHAVTATAALTDAMLHDTLDRRKSISDWALRSVYAMAFCRFVNGFVDRDIAKTALRANAATKADAGGEGTTGNEEGVGAAAATTTSRGESSMYAHAAAIGMPEHFVDLRHRATHDEMPSLEVLRQMAREALDWLWQRWWKVHATESPDRALREREERKLLAEKKAEGRRATQVAQAVETDFAGDEFEQENNEQHRASETGIELAGGDLSGGDLSGASLGKGKRKRYSWHGADVDEAVSENGVNLDGHDNLSRANVKRKKLQSAFGLFELK